MFGGRSHAAHDHARLTGRLGVALHLAFGVALRAGGRRGAGVAANFLAGVIHGAVSVDAALAVEVLSEGWSRDQCGASEQECGEEMKFHDSNLVAEGNEKDEMCQARVARFIMND